MLSTSNSANGKNVKAKIEETSSSVARDFHTFVSDMESLIKSTAHLSGEELDKARQKLNDRIAVAKESVGDVSETVANRARKTAETTNAYVHEQPWSVIGAGAAIGLLVGFLLARRD